MSTIAVMKGWYICQLAQHAKHADATFQTQHGNSPPGSDVCVLHNMAMPTVADQQAAYAIRQDGQ